MGITVLALIRSCSKASMVTRILQRPVICFNKMSVIMKQAVMLPVLLQGVVSPAWRCCHIAVAVLQGTASLVCSCRVRPLASCMCCKDDQSPCWHCHGTITLLPALLRDSCSGWLPQCWLSCRMYEPHAARLADCQSPPCRCMTQQRCCRGQTVLVLQGRVISMLAGEGHKQDLDDLIAAALDVYGDRGELSATPLPLTLERNMDTRQAASSC